MDVSCLIAIDDFSARVVGRFASLVTEASRDEVLEDCLFLWAGMGARPEATDLWSGRDVPWSLPADAEPFRTLHEPAAPGEGATAERAARLARVAERAGGRSEAGRVGWTWLLDEHLPERFGRTSLDSIGIVLACTLADPASCGVLIGLLERISRMRAEGALSLLTREYAVVGIGASTVAQAEPQIARAWSARSIHDLQAYFASADAAARAAACYVVGEERKGGGTLEGESQIGIGAATVLGIVLDGARRLDGAVLGPFRFQRSGSRVEWGRSGSARDPSRPFAAVGAAALQYPKRSLHRLVAARLGERICNVFAAADPDGVPGAAGDGSEREAETRRLDTVRDAALAALGRMKIGLRAGFRPWSWEGAREVVRLAMDERWAPVMSLYGRDRFLRLPLEDWKQGLDELRDFLVEGVIARRRREIEELDTAVLEAIEEGLQNVFAEIGNDAWRAEIDFAPRREAVRVVAALLAEASAAKDKGTREWVQTSHLDEEEIEHLALRERRSRASLLEAIQAIPSPMAVLARSVGITSVCSLLLLAQPFSLGPLDPPLVRLGVAAAIAIASIGLLLRRVRAARARLLACFDDWAEAFRRAQDERDKCLAFESAQRILATIIAFCQWLLGAGSESDFRPRAPHPWEEDIRPRVDEETNAAHRRRFLNRFAEQTREAGKSWRDLAQRVAACVRDATVVQTLPGSDDALVLLADEVLGTEAVGALGHGSVRDHLRRIEERATPAGVPPWLPFRRSDGRQGWAADLRLAEDGEERRTPANTFLQTLEAYAERRLGVVDLRRAMARFYGVAEFELAQHPHTELALFRHLNGASEIPLDHGGGGVESAFVLSTGHADVLARLLGAQQEEIFSPDLLCLLRVRVGLGAEEIVFGGDPALCRSHLGRAFAAHGSALAPLRVERGDRPDAPSGEPP